MVVASGDRPLSKKNKINMLPFMCAAGVMPSQWVSGFVPDDFRVWYMPCVMSLEYMRGCKVANKMASFAALDAVVVAPVEVATVSATCP